MGNSDLNPLIQTLTQIKLLEQAIETRQAQERAADELAEQTELAEEAAARSKLPRMSKQEKPRPGEPAYRGKSIAYWVRMLGDSDDDVSEQAGNALYKIGVPSLPAIIEACLANPHGNSVILANSTQMCGSFTGGRLLASMLCEPQQMAAMQKILKWALDHSNPDFNLWAVHCLSGATGKAVPWAMNHLKTAILNSEGSAKIYALQYYSTLGQDLAVPLLIKVLDNPEKYSYAVNCLKWLETKALAAVPRLVELLKHSNEEIKTEATQALEKIDPHALKKATRGSVFRFWS